MDTTVTKGSKKAIVTMKPLCQDLLNVAETVSLSGALIKRLVRDGKFPKPRQLSKKRVGWLVRELEEWIETTRV